MNILAPVFALFKYLFHVLVSVFTIVHQAVMPRSQQELPTYFKNECLYIIHQYNTFGNDLNLLVKLQTLVHSEWNYLMWKEEQ